MAERGLKRPLPLIPTSQLAQLSRSRPIKRIFNVPTQEKENLLPDQHDGLAKENMEHVIGSKEGWRNVRSRAINDPEHKGAEQCYYNVLFCVRKSGKCYGPWIDGVLAVCVDTSKLTDMHGKTVIKGKFPKCKRIDVDLVIEIGKYKIEVLGLKSKEEEELVRETMYAKSEALRRKDFAIPSTSSPAASAMTINQDSLVLNLERISHGEGAVVVDPYIASKLRPHQREGVKFMYECVMGLRASSFRGCLLADEMGLGKTIQVIALLWTLLQRGVSGQPFLRHAVVICPSSLVENWGKEVRKWLGIERLRALIVHAGLSTKEAQKKMRDFIDDKFSPLLITSYEMLRNHKELIGAAHPDLLVCDEAHRLKNCAGNKTIDALASLKCPRRILLTGTPVQNDLNEFYAMMEFANPDLLGPLSAFKRVYATPINRSRDRNASKEEKELGSLRSQELQRKARFCILRRTADINMKYLPSKAEYVVFCKLHPIQVLAYTMFLRSKIVKNLLVTNAATANVLSAIGVLRKLCNHPMLAQKEMKDVMQSESFFSAHDNDMSSMAIAFSKFEEERNSSGNPGTWKLSGKLSCLAKLLSAISENSNAESIDKTVVVSNFTQTLDLIQALCDSQGWKCLRLDGSTEVSTRQMLVDRFNTSGTEQIFLLSSKAGGTGLNLIGANRLVMFDPDWNPATDAQAMARVWREGQQKPVIIYRLLSTGSIEEKIYQRQLMKSEIASTVGGKKEIVGGRHFSREELKELFTLQLETECGTFDILSHSSQAHMQWQDCSAKLSDPALRRAIQSGVVTFVHKNAPNI